MTDSDPTPSKPAKPRKWRRRLRRGVLGLLAVVGLFALASCIHLDRANPAYPATNAEVDDAIEAMKDDPVGLDRPVVVLSGWRSPSLTGRSLAGRIRKVTGAGEGRVTSISYTWQAGIPEIAATVAQKVADEYGTTTDPATGQRWTTEVDVVAISMGGLVARTAWAEPAAVGRDPGVRLNIKTLYTLGSPHRGAKLATWIRLDESARQMKPGSDFLADLDAATLGGAHDLRIVPYATLRDSWVGATNAAPHGQEPIWVPGRIVLSHHLISLDDRILADLGRRLRGEAPLAEPSAPPRD
ncbi:MAG: lipase family alpha/beta hydrolase [Phycisphaerales bacterium JB060]